MQDSWMEFPQYPGYSISDSGLIRNDRTDRLMKRSRLSNGAPAVSLYVDGRYVRRQVISFMAETWMEPHPNPRFDTPMNLDGDRANCHVTNLVFRPRWFVIAYNKECHTEHYPHWSKPFRIVETGEIFDTPLQCALQYGVLQADIFSAIANKRLLFPGAFTVEYL